MKLIGGYTKITKVKYQIATVYNETGKKITKKLAERKKLSQSTASLVCMEVLTTQES